MAEVKKYFVCKIQGHYLTLDLKPVYEKVLFEGTEKECREFVKMSEGYDIGYMEQQLFEKDERLTEAKELLTRFVMASVYFNGKETDLVEQAEQFLKRNK